MTYTKHITPMILRTFNFFLAILVGLFVVSTAHAATLSFTATQQVTVGDTITVPVVLSTSGSETANAVSAKIKFPADLVTISSVSKNGSIINFWPEEPQYSPSAGTAQFEGVILNPGWSGTQGTLVTLTFKAKASGSAEFKFTDSSVLANDGRGTNILTSAPAKSITIVGGQGVPVAASGAPQITSSSHPDQSRWYKSRDAAFSWIVPSDVTAVRTVYDSAPNTVPSIEYSPPISEKRISTGADGVFYFHVQFKRGDEWGTVGHYKFQIDTVPPGAPDIRLAHPDLSADPRPILLFNTTDSLSGIDHYDVKVDDSDFLTFQSETAKSNPYAPAWLSPGDKTVTVIAYDKAGNTITTKKVIKIDTIDTPIVLEYPSELERGDLLRIRGKTYPGAVVTVYLKDEKGLITSDTGIGNGLGVYSVYWTRSLSPGLYTFTTVATDSKGGISNPTEPITIRVNGQTGVALDFNTWLPWIGGGILILVLLYVIIRLLSKGKFPRFKGKHFGMSHRDHEDAGFLDQLLEEKKLLEKAKVRRNLTKEEEIVLENIKVRIKGLKRDLS